MTQFNVSAVIGVCIKCHGNKRKGGRNPEGLPICVASPFSSISHLIPLQLLEVSNIIPLL